MLVGVVLPFLLLLLLFWMFTLLLVFLGSLFPSSFSSLASFLLLYYINALYFSFVCAYRYRTKVLANSFYIRNFFKTSFTAKFSIIV